MDDGDDDGGGFGADTSLAGVDACERCGSTNCILTDIGEIVCGDCGTQSQDVRHLEQEDNEVQGGVRMQSGGYMLRRVRAGPRASLPLARDAFTVTGLVRAMQSILSAHVDALIAAVGAPAQLSGVVRELWRRYLAHWTVPGAPPPVYVLNSRVVASGSRLYLARVASEGLFPVPCQPLSMPLLLAFCYLGTRWLNLPLLPHDFCGWVRNGTLPYLNAYLRVLPAPAQAVLVAARHFLSPTQPPSPAGLARIATVLSLSVGVALPPLNVVAAAVRLINIGRLPAAAVQNVAELAALDDIDTAWADVYTSTAQSNYGGAAAAARLQKKERAQQQKSGKKPQQHSRGSSSSSSEGGDDSPDGESEAISDSRGDSGDSGDDDGDVGDDDGDDDAAASSNRRSGQNMSSSGRARRKSHHRRDLLSHLRRSHAMDEHTTGAAKVAALVCVSVRLLTGWEAWVDAHLMPRAIGDIGAQRSRLGYTVGPWAVPRLLACGGVNGGGGEVHDAKFGSSSSSGGGGGSSSGGGGSSGSGSINSSDSGSLCFTSSTRADTPFPGAPAHVALLPATLIPAFTRFTSLTVLSGGDVGLGRGELEYPEGAYGRLSVANVDVDVERAGADRGGRAAVSSSSRVGQFADKLRRDDEAARAPASSRTSGTATTTADTTTAAADMDDITALLLLGPRGAAAAAAAAAAGRPTSSLISSSHLNAAAIGRPNFSASSVSYAAAAAAAAPLPVDSVEVTLGSRSLVMSAYSRTGVWPEKALPDVAAVSSALRKWGVAANTAAAANTAGDAATAAAGARANDDVVDDDFIDGSGGARAAAHLANDDDGDGGAVAAGTRTRSNDDNNNNIVHRNTLHEGSSSTYSMDVEDSDGGAAANTAATTTRGSKAVFCYDDVDDDDAAAPAAGTSATVTTTAAPSASAQQVSNRSGGRSNVDGGTGISSSVIPGYIMYPRQRQPMAPDGFAVPSAPRPRCFDVHYEALLRMLSCIVDASVDSILAHVDVLELLLQLHTPMPEHKSSRADQKRSATKKAKTTAAAAAAAAAACSS